MSSQDVADRSLRQAQDAVAIWSGFPYQIEPRPPVLVGPSAFIRGNFVSGDAKRSHLGPSIDADPLVPAAALECLADTWQLVNPPLPGANRLHVLSASHGEAPFSGDRGELLLPAWIFQIDGLIGDIVALDRNAARVWELASEMDPHDIAYNNDSAILSEDGYSLHLTFYAPDLFIEAFAGGEAVESPAAVAIVPSPVYRGSRTAAAPAFGRAWTVTVRLRVPLGPRVLVGLDGTPTPVRPPADSECPQRACR